MNNANDADDAPLAEGWVNPSTLLSPLRFDLVAKYLYATQLLNSMPAEFRGRNMEELYRKHIHCRTGGQEPPGTTHKTSVGDYVEQFAALISSMAAKGFDPKYPVTFSQADGLPHDGAHRVAAAIASNQKVVRIFRADIRI